MSDLIWTTKKEIADKLKISERTLQEWEKDGLPIKKIGKTFVLNPEEIRDFLKKK